MSLAIDINSNGRYLPQFDSERPVTPLEALRDGNEAAGQAFAEWVASDAQRTLLDELLSYLADDPVVEGMAERWASEQEGEAV